jgi:transposase
MPREKGTQKTGGREKGTPNKVTADIKAWLVSLINKNKRQVEKDLEKLDPKDRLLMFEKLMQYVIPKMQAITPESDQADNYTIEDVEAIIEKQFKIFNDNLNGTSDDN